MEIYYIEATCTVIPTEPFSDLLMAELGALGFESFEQTPTGIKAYILESAFDDSLFEGLETADMPGVSLTFLPIGWPKKTGTKPGKKISNPLWWAVIAQFVPHFTRRLMSLMIW